MKRGSLSAALKEVGRPEAAPAAGSVANRQSQPGNVPPSRAGKRAITGFFDPAVSKQLKQIALDNDKTIQDLMREALNDLFQKHSRSRIA